MMDYRKQVLSLLVLTGLSSTAIATWQPRHAPQVRKGEANRLTLQLRGLRAAWVEVEVDGIIVATRHLTGQSDVLTLHLQSAGLAPGRHDAVVKIYDAQGRLISQRTMPIELLPDPNSPLTIVSPRNGAQVAGTVPIEARVNRRDSVYVSFFVDGQIRGLRNYPPYIYNWDTTRESNGWHTIEVWSYDGNQTLRTPPMRVFVNNPGGRTEREPLPETAEVEPAMQVAASEPAVADSALRIAAAPEARPSEAVRLRTPEARPSEATRLRVPEARPSEATQLRVPEARPSEAVRLRTPEARLSEATRLRAPKSPAEIATEPRVAPALAEPVFTATVNGFAAAQPSPNRPVAPQQEPSVLATATTPTQMARELRGVQAEPQMRGQKLRAPQVAHAPTPPATANAAPSTASVLVRLEYGTRLPAGVLQFGVVVDAAPIAFDVAPRVEDGVALIPVRHVLEQLGAQVRWDHQHKTATLQLGARTAVLRVRENEVRVDGKPIPLEARLRIMRGRILVPPAVLRELLDAELLYDGATGQVIINTGRE
jgi:hypothetical protein